MYRKILFVDILGTSWIQGLIMWINTKGNLIDSTQAISVTQSLGFLKPFAAFPKCFVWH